MLSASLAQRGQELGGREAHAVKAMTEPAKLANGMLPSCGSRSDREVFAAGGDGELAVLDAFGGD